MAKEKKPKHERFDTSNIFDMYNGNSSYSSFASTTTNDFLLLRWMKKLKETKINQISDHHRIPKKRMVFFAVWIFDGVEIRQNKTKKTSDSE